MKTGNKKQTRGNSRQNQRKDDKPPTKSEDTANVSMLAEQEAMEAKIIAEIQAIRVDVKKELSEAIGTLKSELVDFRGEISTKLNGISSELREITDRVEATEQRVADVEESHAEAAEMLTYTLELQKSIQTQLTDLEARSRRNNIRIHGIPEGAEGDNMKTFLEEFFKSVLSLTEPPLGIQRCHRSLGPRPPQSANPRSVLVYFLEYTTKEKVLRSAWGKKELQYDGRRVFFEQDYPTEIYMKRKAYTFIRKALKEKDIRFQTLYPAKLRVFFDTGPVVYNNVEEATDDLRKRGLIPDGHGADPSAQSAPSARSRQTPWETAGSKSRRQQEVRLKRIQERLKGFRRSEEAS